MVCCCAVRCSNRSQNGHKMYSIPMGENTERRKIWLHRISRRDFNPRCVPFVSVIYNPNMGRVGKNIASTTNQPAEGAGRNKNSNIANEICPPTTANKSQQIKILSNEIVTQNVSNGESEDDSSWEDVSSDEEEEAAINEDEMSMLREIFIDSEDFIRIVDSAAFIDKTLLIKNLFYKPSYKYMKTLLVAAPQQSGKSVNMNMVKRFLEIEVDNEGKQKNSVKWDSNTKMWLEQDDMTENFKLFKEKNLKIYQCRCETKHTEDEMKMGMCPCRQFFYENCGQHPVVFVSFHGVECYTWYNLLSTFRSLLNRVYRKFRYLEHSKKISNHEKVYFKCFVDGKKSQELTEHELCEGLEILVSCLHQHFGKKVVLLIDHSDAPFIKFMQLKGKGDMVGKKPKLIKKMVTSVIQGNENLLGVLMNATNELFTNLSEHENNIKKCAFLENRDFSKFYGFTKQDINELLQRPEFKEFTEEKILEYYNGNSVLEGSFKVYGVYFLMRYLENCLP